MKIFTAFCAAFLLFLSAAWAQSDVSAPVFMKPVYFDVSPPLRDLAKLKDQPNDQTWKDGIVKNNLHPKRNQAPYMDDSKNNDPVSQYYFGSTPADTTIQNFEGVGANGGVPPDTDGEVGPNHFFQVVNTKYAIYNKSGVKLLGPVNTSNIWSGMPNNSNDGDAIVLYDENADRWLISQFSLPNYPSGPFYEMVAVSQTSDPTGSYNRYQYQFAYMPDYPKLSVWEDAYYMTANRFSAGSISFIGVGAYAMDRAKMIAGDPNAGIISFTLPASNEAWRMLSADCDTDFPPTGTPCYFLYLNDGPDRIGIYEFHTDWTNTANSTFTQVTNLGVQAFTGTISSGIPQKGTSIKLDAIAGSLMFRLPFVKFDDHWSMVACATVNTGSGHAGIRWFELRNTGSGWSIYQQATYNPDANHRWMGSIAMDTAGNIALAFSISSTDMYPSIYYTGRMANDPLNEMTIAESGIYNGGGSQTNNWTTPSRWGDYSCISVDPTSPATFWYTQEYYQTTSQSNWKTRIASFSFANLLMANASATPDVTCSGDSTQLHVEAEGGSGTYTYSWSSVPPGFTSTEQDPWATPTESTRYAVEVNDGTNVTHDTVDVTVMPNPLVNAGNDTTYCIYVQDYELTGYAESFSTLLWTTSGDGTFEHPTIPNATYHPGPGDKANLSVTLTLTGGSINPCSGEVSDQVNILIDPCTGIPDPATNPYAIHISPNPTNGQFGITIGGMTASQADLVITDIHGRQVYAGKLIPAGHYATAKIDFSNMAKGIYLVKAMSSQGTLTEKLVVH